MLADGSVVDVWGRRDYVEWSMPGTGAPCTSTSRPGRWRSFPYLAELEGEDAEVLWGYLCKQWNSENDADRNPGRRLLRYKVCFHLICNWLSRRPCGTHTLFPTPKKSFICCKRMYCRTWLSLQRENALFIHMNAKQRFLAHWKRQHNQI